MLKHERIVFVGFMGHIGIVRLMKKTEKRCVEILFFLPQDMNNVLKYSKRPICYEKKCFFPPPDKYLKSFSKFIYGNSV